MMKKWDLIWQEGKEYAEDADKHVWRQEVIINVNLDYQDQNLYELLCSCAHYYSDKNLTKKYLVKHDRTCIPVTIKQVLYYKLSYLEGKRQTVYHFPWHADMKQDRLRISA